MANISRRGLFGLVVVVLAVVLGYLYLSSAEKNQEVTIAQAGHFFLYAPLYVAIDAGHFEQQGIKVNIVTTGGDEKTWAAVLSGDAQFGVADPVFIAIAAERGKPGRVISAVVNGVPFWGITNRAGIQTFTSASDLNGYTVATFPQPSTAFALQRRMFVDAGLEPKIRQGAFGALLPILEAGDADIALELEPNVSAAIDNGYRVVYSLDDVYGDFAITGLTSTPEYVTENKSVVAAMVCGLDKALKLIHDNQDRALDLLQKRFPEIKSEVARRALQRVVEANIIPSSPVVSEDAWNKAVELRRSIGDLEKAAPAEIFLEMSFARSLPNRCQS